jgi:putative ABC transport system permease protein
LNFRFVFRHALRESRSSWKRLALYMSSITLGVAALVAINSFRTNAETSVRDESRSLLGADARVWSNRPFAKPMIAVLDSASRRYDVARVTTLISMAVAANSGQTRLVQLSAIEPGYPFYGDIETQPSNQWQSIQNGPRVVVDEALLTQLDVAVGDSLLLGNKAFVIAASLKKAPSDYSFRNALGPRVYIASKQLAATGLLRFGSMAQYQAYLRIPSDKQTARFVSDRRAFMRRNMIGFTTAREQSEQIAKALGSLSRFLGLVGLAALLLGGIGVATAVHVFVKSKRAVIAMLRCVGAQERTVFAAYLAQAAAMAFAGALAGVILGLIVQSALPTLMKSVMPFDVAFSIDWLSVAAGLGIGVLIAILFAIIPLLSIRGVSPLQALRADYEPGRSRVDWAQAAAMMALLTTITGLSIWQADNVVAGLAFALGLAITLAILWLIAWALTRAAKRMVPQRARFTLRQGIANLYRPRNQTVSVTLSLGFGVFIIATMLGVQTNLLGWLNIENKQDAPNVLAFDIQSDQAASVARVFERHHARATTFTPIVPARIVAINDVPVDSLVLRKDKEHRIEPWVLRREYRNTYRDTMVASERVVAGSWFNHTAGAVPPISIEQDVANDLQVKLGDRITWDIEGRQVASQIASIRRVDWAQFNTNFFVVFPNGVLENAPHTFVALGRVDGIQQRAALQRDVVATNPNVSVIDLANVREALEDIIGRVTMAIRFMALFSIIAGVIVLIGAVATSRFQRLRESALLKTIGASRRQITEVLVTEYAALGTLAGATGVLLGGIASWLLTKKLFRLDYHLPLGALLIVWFGVAALAVFIGLANSRDVFRRAPLAVLREISE